MSDVAWSMSAKILAGIVLYGGLGWLLDRWFGHKALFLPVGVIAGAALALYLVFVSVDGNPPPGGDD
jgi:ATP synthase protein I